MFSNITAINFIKYLVPLFLGFLLGFYLAEHVTTKIHVAQYKNLKSECDTTTLQLQTKLTSLIESQNSIANTLNSTSSVLAQVTSDVVAKETALEQKALIKYRDKIVLVKEPCKLSEPGLDYIKEHVTGN